MCHKVPVTFSPMRMKLLVNVSIESGLMQSVTLPANHLSNDLVKFYKRGGLLDVAPGAKPLSFINEMLIAARG